MTESTAWFFAFYVQGFRSLNAHWWKACSKENSGFDWIIGLLNISSNTFGKPARPLVSFVSVLRCSRGSSRHRSFSSGVDGICSSSSIVVGVSCRYAQVSSTSLNVHSICLLYMSLRKYSRNIQFFRLWRLKNKFCKNFYSYWFLFRWWTKSSKSLNHLTLTAHTANDNTTS